LKTFKFNLFFDFSKKLEINLPTDIIKIIAEFLQLNEFSKLFMTSKEIYESLQDENFYINLYKSKMKESFLFQKIDLGITWKEFFGML
jgi:hypothetical protein